MPKKHLAQNNCAYLSNGPEQKPATYYCAGNNKVSWTEPTTMSTFHKCPCIPTVR